MYDLIIIGGGIAGMSAAICASGRGMNFVVIEREKLGGKVGKVSTIVNFAGAGFNESGREFIKRVEKQMEEEHVNVLYEEVQEVNLMSEPKIVRTNKDTYEAKTVILANGTNPNAGRFKGEKEFRGKGVYFDPEKYAQEVKDKVVVVAGGSEYTVKEALELAKIAKEVHLVHYERKLMVEERYEKAMEEAGIVLHLGCRIESVSGAEHVETVTILQEETREKTELQAQAVFLFMGSHPRTAMYKEIRLDSGYIESGADTLTNIAGVFAAGDIRRKNYRQIATSVADGTNAALAAYFYLKK